MKTLSKWLAAALAVGITAALGACADNRPPVSIGLITKQETNPYWVTWRTVAEDSARKAGATLTTATGSSDVDVEAQRTALKEMVDKGVNGILITPTNSTALAADIQAARDKGITVIALDTPMEPQETTNAYFGTDNKRAGELIGRYARAKSDELGLSPQIMMLNLSPGITSGENRSAGFQEGFDIPADSGWVVEQANIEGDRGLAQQAMTEALTKKPAAQGAVDALKSAGKDLARTVVVAVDGGCEAMKNSVRPGDIDATAMQFPQNMAREGVEAIVAKVREGREPSGYLATGTELVTGSPAPGVTGKNVEYGVRTCWGG